MTRQPRASAVRFTDDGQTLLVSKPDVTPPLVNVISLGGYGTAAAQTGAGFAWRRAPSEAVTRGLARDTRDAGGRALYLRDEAAGRAWSVGWQPLRVSPQSYECAHGVGHTLVTSQTDGVQAQWLVFVPWEEPLEVWRVRLRNLSKKARSLTLWSAVEWAPQRASSAKDKGFVQDDGMTLLARARPSTAAGWDGVLFHGVNRAPKAHALDRRAFWGAYGSAEAPEALKTGRYAAAGDEEPFAGFCVPVKLKPGEERSILFTVGCAEAQSEAVLKARKFRDFAQVDLAWNRTQMFWDRLLTPLTVETPDPAFDRLVNVWLKYRALSRDLWSGRGPKDARVFLPLDPHRVRQEILARATATRPLAAPFSDVPWPLLLVEYLKETGEGAFLKEKVSAKATLLEAAGKVVSELAAQPVPGGAWTAQLLAGWREMAAWAAADGHLSAKDAGAAQAAVRKAPAARAEGDGPLGHVRALCAKGRAKDAWEAFRRAAPLAAPEEASAVFSAEPLPGAAAPADLLRAAVEDILGVRAGWNGLVIRPCLPPSWRSARVRREFRGASYDIAIRRIAKPAGFVEVIVNGEKIAGGALPILFGAKNRVEVAVGRAA